MMHVDIMECGDEVRLTLVQSISRKNPHAKPLVRGGNVRLYRLEKQMRELLEAYTRG
jgi:hypothetical protein